MNHADLRRALEHVVQGGTAPQPHLTDGALEDLLSAPPKGDGLDPGRAHLLACADCMARWRALADYLDVDAPDADPPSARAPRSGAAAETPRPRARSIAGWLGLAAAIGLVVAAWSLKQTLGLRADRARLTGRVAALEGDRAAARIAAVVDLYPSSMVTRGGADPDGLPAAPSSSDAATVLVVNALPATCAVLEIRDGTGAVLVRQAVTTPARDTLAVVVPGGALASGGHVLEALDAQGETVDTFPFRVE